MEANASQQTSIINNDLSNSQDITNGQSEKLKLQSIIEAVGFLMFPSYSYTNLALKELLIENNLFDIFRAEYSILFSHDSSDSLNKFQSPSEDLIVSSLMGLMKFSNRSERKIERTIETFERRLGYIYFKYLYNDYEKALRSIGSDMYKFYNNLNSLQESLINHVEFGPRFLFLHEKFTGYSPSFYCLPSSERFPLFAKSPISQFRINHKENVIDSDESMDIYVIQENGSSFFNNFFEGLIESTANFLWNLQVHLEKMGMSGLNAGKDLQKKSLSKKSPCVMAYRVRLTNQTWSKHQKFHFSDKLSSNPNDLCINVDLMRAIFPFSLIFDRCMEIKHVGDGLVRYVGPSIIAGYGTNFLTYFTIVSPKLNEYSFSTIMINQNMSYKLRTNTIDSSKSSQFKDMELKGSISYLSEVDSLIFIGSPIISRLEELTRRELYISDIPIHDATRDIILVGEQTKAQEGLKFRMEKLKKSIVQAHEDFEREKQKNIEILNLIFPSDIAEKLWRGEKVVARSVENVTLLYSDIVGFTSICSVSQPIEIIAMLKGLYTEFDHFCGLLDIYKIETIGDAYIVAGGLHKPSQYHCLQIAWMSLLMMESASKNYTPNGTEIKIRIGLHSGEVLAGIVGFKQPRYCLFGNNCAIANKFESLSEEKKIHLSPVTKKLMEHFDGFEYEKRTNDFLPENWIKKEHTETSWFLLSYKNKHVSKNEPCLAHVKTGLQQYKMNN